MGIKSVFKSLKKSFGKFKTLLENKKIKDFSKKLDNLLIEVYKFDELYNNNKALANLRKEENVVNIKIKGKNISKSPKQVKLKKIISKQGYFKKRLSSKELENMSLREQLICLIERFKVVE